MTKLERIQEILDQYKTDGDIVSYTLSMNANTEGVTVVFNSKGDSYYLDITNGVIKINGSEMNLLDILNAKSILSFIVKGE